MSVQGHLVTPLRALTSAEKLGRRRRVTKELGGRRGVMTWEKQLKLKERHLLDLIYQSPPDSSQSSLAFSSHNIC